MTSEVTVSCESTDREFRLREWSLAGPGQAGEEGDGRPGQLASRRRRPGRRPHTAGAAGDAAELGGGHGGPCVRSEAAETGRVQMGTALGTRLEGPNFVLTVRCSPFRIKTSKWHTRLYNAEMAVAAREDGRAGRGARVQRQLRGWGVVSGRLGQQRGQGQMQGQPRAVRVWPTLRPRAQAGRLPAARLPIGAQGARWRRRPEAAAQGKGRASEQHLMGSGGCSFSAGHVLCRQAGRTCSR